MEQLGVRDSAGPISFGRLLRRYRQDANLTQEALAARAKLSAQAISLLEREVRRRPRRSTVLSLVQALRLDPVQAETLLAASEVESGHPVPDAGEPDHDQDHVPAAVPLRPAPLVRRLVAAAVDTFVLGVVLIVQSYCTLLVVFNVAANLAGVDPNGPRAPYGLALIVVVMVQLLVSWAYAAISESSPWQATLGKKTARIRVTDMQGRRITLARASVRRAGNILVLLTLYTGHLAIAVTRRHRGLHDLLAGTQVVRR